MKGQKCVHHSENILPAVQHHTQSSVLPPSVYFKESCKPYSPQTRYELVLINPRGTHLHAWPCLGDSHTRSDIRNADEGATERVCGGLVVDFGKDYKSYLAFHTDMFTLERRPGKLGNCGFGHHRYASKNRKPVNILIKISCAECPCGRKAVGC